MARLRAAVVLTVLACPACRVVAPVAVVPEVATYEVAVVRNVAYYDGPDADERHALDLYLPRGLSHYPVVVLVHGGAWTIGDKGRGGFYPAVADGLARQGIGVVVPNYRLSPAVRHPEHARDVARAVAWAKAHLVDHGGEVDALFLAGHSAGGHLVALVATDGRYLEAEGLSAADVAGVVGVSGVYHIPPGDVSVTLGGSSRRALHLGALFPLASPTRPSNLPDLDLPAIPLTVNFFGPVFGYDARGRADASPVFHVRPGLPPFLLFVAENELPLLEDGAEMFQRALANHGNDVRLLRARGRNHNSILFCATEPNDPVAAEVVRFVKERTPRP